MDFLRMASARHMLFIALWHKDDRCAWERVRDSFPVLQAFIVDHLKAIAWGLPQMIRTTDVTSVTDSKARTASSEAVCLSGFRR
jgi:hypothetical protein